MAVQNSINTNPGVFVALRTLNSVNRNLDVAQNRVSTGLKVSGALDDASNFAIAQGIRGELKAIGAVTQGLNTAKGIGKVAVAGTTAVSNLLTDIRSKLTELSNEGITTNQRAILEEDFNQLVSQAANFIDNAVFNGVNLLDTAGASPAINTLSNLTGGSLTLSNADLRTQVLSLAGASFANASAAQAVLSTQYAALESVADYVAGYQVADSIERRR